MKIKGFVDYRPKIPEDNWWICATCKFTVKVGSTAAEQTQRMINSVASRLQAGESFATLAKELSDDPGSGSEGGELGWAQPGQMVPEFEQVMNATAINEISQPFESRFGWHILQVEARRQQDLGDQIRENQARSILNKRKYSEELANWLREIRAEAYVDIKI